MLNNFLTKFCTISLRCTVGKIESSIPHMQCRWNQSLWVASAFYQDSSIAASSRMIRKLLVQNTLQDWRFISSFTVAVIICFFLTNHSTKLLISSPLLPELEQELETHASPKLTFCFRLFSLMPPLALISVWLITASTTICPVSHFFCTSFRWRQLVLISTAWYLCKIRFDFPLIFPVFVSSKSGFQ